jgi:hypothetical protein
MASSFGWTGTTLAVGRSRRLVGEGGIFSPPLNRVLIETAVKVDWVKKK